MSPPEPTRSERFLRLLAVVFGIVLIGTAGALVQHFVVEEDHPRPWNPLGKYPVQRVTNPGRLVPRGGTVGVDSVKCNASSHPVTVHGRSQWQSVSPLGTQFLSGEGTAIRMPGCTRSHYENPIPPVIAVRAAQLCQTLGYPSTWQITGRELPSRARGTGVARAWRTESFRLGC